MAQKQCVALRAILQHEAQARDAKHQEEPRTENNVHSGQTKLLEERLRELIALPRAWDGYQGVPVRLEYATFAAEILKKYSSLWIEPPELVPGSDGSLQLEWHQHGFDVEIDILGPNNTIATRFDHESQELTELELQTDFTAITQWFLDIEHRERASLSE